MTRNGKLTRLGRLIRAYRGVLRYLTEAEVSDRKVHGKRFHLYHSQPVVWVTPPQPDKLLQIREILTDLYRTGKHQGNLAYLVDNAVAAINTFKEREDFEKFMKEFDEVKEGK